MARVTGFDLGFGNSALRHPYALAVLDCGHRASVVLRPNRGACNSCHAERDLPIGQAQHCCGRSYFVITYWPNPHNAADRATQIGDAIECANCAREAQEADWLEALEPSVVQHARFRYGSYHFYRRDQSSPSGVFLVGSVTPTPRVEAILRAKRIAPLSPTEPR